MFKPGDVVTLKSPLDPKLRGVGVIVLGVVPPAVVLRYVEKEAAYSNTYYALLTVFGETWACESALSPVPGNCQNPVATTAGFGV